MKSTRPSAGTRASVPGPARRSAALVTSALVLCLLAPPIAAQSTDPSIPREPTGAQADALQQALDSATDLAEADIANGNEMLRAARAAIKSADEQIPLIDALRAVIRGGPDRVAELKGERERPTPALDPGEGQGQSVEQLETLVAAARADAQRFEARVADLEAEIATLVGAPRSLRSELETVDRDVAAARTAAAPADRAAEDTLGSIRDFLARARLRAEETRLVHLKLELDSLTLRAQLASLERDVVKRNASVARSRADGLESLLAKTRAAVARETRIETERAREQASDRPSVVREVAEANAQYASELTKVTQALARLTAERSRFEQTLQTVTQDFQTAKTRLEVAGLSSAIGTLLRDQRNALPDARAFAERAQGRQRRIGEVSVAQFKIDDALLGLGDLDKTIAGLVADAGVKASAGDALDAVAIELKKLLIDRRDVLQSLRGRYADQLKALGELEFVEQRLSLKVEEYAEFLDERLLWIPSTHGIRLADFRDAVDGIRWLFAPRNLSELPPAVVRALIDRPVLMVALIVVVVFLLRQRARLRKRFEAISARVQSIYSDRFSLTVEAVAISLLLVLPTPLLIGVLAYELQRVEDASNYVLSVAAGLSAMAVPLFGVRAFRTLYIPHGVGISHFQWSPDLCQSMRRALWVFLLLLLPTTFLISLTRTESSGDFESNLGRIAFLAMSVAIVQIARSVLHPDKGIWIPFLTRDSTSWLSRMRWIWYPIAASIPISLAVLSLLGYHYTALTLLEPQKATIRVLVVAFVSYYLIARALEVAERRLALKVAQRDRRMRQERLEAEAGGEAQGVTLDVPRLDVETINAQTRGLTRVFLGWSIVIALYLIWDEVLPALNVLDGVTLWGSVEMISGQQVKELISVSDLLLALLMALLFLVAARNIPGVLEVVILSRLPVDAGIRYATSTLVQYAIIAVGVVVVFQSIGVGWSKVQWLVAALGVGLGFGLQEIFANFISGIIILFERPVRIGDTVTLGELTGTVTRIRMRATTVTDWDKKEIVIPNKTFITERLINWTLSDPITRVVIPVGVAYGSDTKLVHRLISEQAEANPLVLKDPKFQVFFLGFGASSLDFELRVFVDDLSGFLAVRHQLHMAIDEVFREHGVEISFPQRDLHIRSAVPLEIKNAEPEFKPRAAE